MTSNEYLLLAKKYAKGGYTTELELGIWLAKWYSRTYGISLKESMDMTIDDLMIEFYAAPYFKDPSLLSEEEDSSKKLQQYKADEEWVNKVTKEGKEEIDPKVKEMMDKFKPMEFGE